MNKLRTIRLPILLAFFLAVIGQIGETSFAALPQSGDSRVGNSKIESDPEIIAIKATLEDYIQGSTNGQPTRLKKAFHPDLNLYSIKNRKLNVWRGTAYIADTKEGKPTGETGKIIAIDYENDTAMGKVEIVPPRGNAYVDYFMLLKIERRWTIVHKMYTRRNGSSGSAKYPAEKATDTPAKKKDPPTQSDPNPETTADQPATNREIDKLLSEYDRTDTPGVAVAVIRNGKVVYQRAVGAANVEHQVPIDAAKTIFNIGSTSKHFTGFAIALLADQGKLSLDDDIRKHVPELPDLGQKITIRHLANHTSGLRSELSLLAMAGWSPGDVIRKRHVFHVLKRQKELNFPVGDRFDYCNSGFTLLAEIVARVSGKPFHQFCHDEIFSPMGMSNTQFSTGQTELRPNLAYSYGFDSSGYFPRNPNDEYSGPTGVWSTCEDMAKWATNFQTQKFGSKKVWSNMLNPGRLNNGKSTNYSLGLFVQPRNGHQHIYHGGATASYRAFLGHFPNDELTIAAVSNSQSINPQQLSLDIADLFLKDLAKSTSEPNKIDSNEKPESEITLTSEKIEQYTGRYWNGEDRTASISFQDDSLVYSIDSGPNIPLKPVSQTEFEMVGVDAANLKFEKNQSGGVSILIPRSDGSINRLEPYVPATPTVEELRAFTGRYYSSELDCSYTIRFDNERLVVDHVRFQGVRLIPVADDVFRNDGWRFTTMQFERASDGKPTSFRIHSLRNRNLEFVRLSEVDSVNNTPTNKTQLSFDEMDATAEELLKQQHLPGLAVVVTENGKTVFKKGYGLANVENQTAVDPDKTLFRIGSVSKAFTFLVLTRLIDQGRLKRTDNVENFIGNVGNPRNYKEPVTIDDLLMHTGGFDQVGTGRHIRDHHLNLKQRKSKRASLVDFLESNNLRRVTDAGEMFRYDTYGVTLAGAIIEKVTGKPFAAAMKQEMFEPLGMNRSFVEVDETHFSDLATGYGWRQGSFQARPYEVYLTTPASSIDMTPADMGRLMEALTSGGANSNGRLLGKEITKAVLSPQFKTHPEFVGITHGFFESYTSNESNSSIHLSTIGHGGSMDGYRCALTIIPEKQVGIFFIANRAPESGGGTVDFRPLLDIVVNQFDDSPKVAKFVVPPQSPEGDALQKRLSEYAADYYYGIYCHTPTREDMKSGAWRRPDARSVSVVDQGLLIGDETYLPYKETEKDVFVQSNGDRLVHFGRNAKGMVTHFVYSTSPDTFEKEMPDLPYRQYGSLAQRLVDIATTENPGAAIKFLREKGDSEDYYISEREFNNAGYQLIEQQAFGLAIEIFKTNTQQFPDSWNAHDSLGEAYANAGKSKLAIES
ncbi:MAG: serine hydrolase, partial [Mariniblastus sp.]